MAVHFDGYNPIYSPICNVWRIPFPPQPHQWYFTKFFDICQTGKWKKWHLNAFLYSDVLPFSCLKNIYIFFSYIFMISLPHSIGLLCFPFYLIWSVCIRGMRYPLISTYCEFKLIFFWLVIFISTWLTMVFLFSKGKESEAAQSCPTLCDSHGLQSPRLLCQWDFPSKSTGVGCHFLLQGILPTQGLNLGLPHCRQTLYPRSHQGSPFFKRSFLFCSIFIFFDMAFDFYSLRRL